MKPLLVVYYSRSGYTRRAAVALADAARADIEEIRPLHDYQGPVGAIRAACDALLHRRPPIAPPRHLPADYETVLIGGPVWAGRMAAPVRSFAASLGPDCRRLAAFCTMGGRNGDAVLDALARLAGRPLAWRAAWSDADIDAGAHLACVRGDSGRLAELLAGAQAPSGTGQLDHSVTGR